MRIVTGAPTHSVGAGQVTVAGVCRLSVSVTVRVGPAGGFTCAGQAMTSCRPSVIIATRRASWFRPVASEL